MGGASGAGSPVCVPGRQEACACLAGAMGVQVCSAAATGFGVCECPATDGAVADAPVPFDALESLSDGGPDATDGRADAADAIPLDQDEPCPTTTGAFGNCSTSCDSPQVCQDLSCSQDIVASIVVPAPLTIDRPTVVRTPSGMGPANASCSRCSPLVYALAIEVRGGAALQYKFHVDPPWYFAKDTTLSSLCGTPRQCASLPSSGRTVGLVMTQAEKAPARNVTITPATFNAPCP